MSEPVSSITATTATLATVSFASLFANTPAGVYVGAFTGAVVYVLSSQELSRFAQVGYFVASFLLGIMGADFTTAILSKLLASYLPVGTVVDTWLGATVTAALGVCILIAMRKINIQTLAGRILSMLSGGGGNGSAK